jgi:hypothetical protein
MKHTKFPNRLNVNAVTRRKFSIIPILLSVLLIAATAATSPEKTSSIFKEIKRGGAMCEFGGKFGGNITLRELSGAKQLSVRGFTAATITSFKLTIVNEKWTQTYLGTKAQLTPKMLTTLRNAGKGAKIEFSDVKVKFRNREMHARGVKLTAV